MPETALVHYNLIHIFDNKIFRMIVAVKSRNLNKRKHKANHIPKHSVILQSVKETAYIISCTEKYVSVSPR